MINKFDLAKALYEQAKLVAANNSYLLIPEGKAYEPDPNETFIREAIVYGPDIPMGLADDSGDAQMGFYQLAINTPKANDGSTWAARKIAGVLEVGFARGTQLIYNSQMVRIKNVTLREIESTDTHKVSVLTVNYTVIN